MGRPRRGSPARTACAREPSRPRARPHTSRSGSSTAESLRQRPSREHERAWAECCDAASGPRRRLRRSFSLLPVVQVGSDLGAQLYELKLWLDPRHGASSLESSGRNSTERFRPPIGCCHTMHVELRAGEPSAIGADLVAAAAGARALELGAPQRAVTDADPVAMVFTQTPPLAVVALAPGVEGLRTAAARAVRACRGGGTVAWALDAALPVPVEDQGRALAEGAVIGGYDGRRWRSGEPPRAVERFVICGAGEQLAPVAARAALLARWTNVARELVDAPPNVMSPVGLAERAAAVPGVASEAIMAGEAGLGALAAVGGSGAIEPRLIVLRHEPAGAPGAPRLALVGKAVTFDTGGYFLKPQSDIVRQKADMAGGAAVVAALGAIAELGLPLAVTGVVPACENMLSA